MTSATTIIPETPSKKMTASFAKQFTLESPTKKSAVKKIDDERMSTSPDTVADWSKSSVKSEERLLKESKRRFVLFPIQYHEEYGYNF
ncbi:hypothetical protein BDZ89DRAFT_1150147 [Hymenopellis radicata]|nr:hypothetical protein BDZ89DRAFT_1150147 [Hymenopellis radicata]